MGNKNHLKNINYQNFVHFMRGYDKGFYGISKIIQEDQIIVHTTTHIEWINPNYDTNAGQQISAQPQAYGVI